MKVIGRVVFRCLVCQKERVGNLRSLDNHLKTKHHKLRLSTDKAWMTAWLQYAHKVVESSGKTGKAKSDKGKSGRGEGTKKAKF